MCGFFCLPATLSKPYSKCLVAIIMRNLFLGLASVLVVSACSSPASKQGDTDSASSKSDTSASLASAAKSDSAISSLCFIHTEGKDSTSIELVVNGDKVTGIMNWLPYQKDARKGKLDGKLHGDTARVTWSFMQEGMTDTLNLNFLLKKDQLSQKPLKLNKQTGRQQTDEAAGYSSKYEPSASVKK